MIGFKTTRAWPRRSPRMPTHMARPSAWPKVLAMCMLLLLGLGGSLLAGTGSTRGVALVVGGLVAVGLLILRLDFLLGLMFALSFVLVGGLGYFTQIEVIYWVPFGMGLLLYFRFLILALQSDGQSGGRPLSLTISLLFGYLALVVASGVINEIGFSGWVLTVKHFVLLWSALLILHYAVRKERTFDWMWRAIFIAGLVQVPVVIYQYIVVGSRLADKGISGADAVSGTLGGSETGGASAALSFLAVTVLLLALALFRAGRLKARYLVTAVVSSLLVLALAEVKAAVLILLPVGLLLLYRRNLLRRPVAFIGGAAACALMIFTIFFGYQQLHYSRVSGSANNLTVPERIERALGQETQTSTQGLHMHDLGRTALLQFWFTEHRKASLSEILIGHGPASTRSGKFGTGAIAVQYYMVGLTKTPVSILLWEVGVIGFSLVLSMLLVSAWSSNRLAKDLRIPAAHRAYLETGTVVLILLAISIFYSRYVIDTPPIQLLSMLCMGQVGYWQFRLWQAQGSMTTKQNAEVTGGRTIGGRASVLAPQVGFRAASPAPHHLR